MPDTRDVYGDAIRDAERAAGAGDFARAETALRHALELQERQFGAAHPDLASTLNNLAVVCETNGRLDEAEQFYRRAFAVASAALPPGDSLVETSRANLEDFCRAHGRAVDDWPELSHRSGSAAAEPPPLPVTPAGAATPPRSSEPPQASTPGAAAPVARPAALPPASSASAASRPGGAATTSRAPRGFVAALAALALIGTIAIAWFAFGPARSSPPTAGTAPAAESREASAPAAAPPPATPAPSPSARPAPPPASSAAPATEPAASRPAAPPPTVRDADRSTAAPPAAPPRAAPTRPAPEAVEPAPDSGVAAVRLVEAAVCTRLARQGRQWTCAPAGDAVRPGAVSFYTRIATARATRIEHRWYRNDELARAITLSVGASDSEGYRTFSQQTITPGRWRVEARTTDGRMLRDVRFEVRE